MRKAANHSFKRTALTGRRLTQTLAPMKNLVPMSIKRVRRLQIGVAAYFVGVAITLSFIAKTFGFPLWSFIVLWAVTGPATIFTLRQIGKNMVCPSCGTSLSRVEESLSAQGKSIDFCPACGEPLGANNSLKVDGPDGPQP